MTIKKIIETIYEHSKTPYPTTQERIRAQEEFLSSAVGYQNILDLCIGDGYTLKLLRKNNPQARITAFSGNPDELNSSFIQYVDETYGSKDIHDFLESLKDKSFDLILARHIIEHSIMPFAILCLLNYKLVPNGHLFAVLPQDNKEMIYYKNHYSVLSKDLWEYLFKMSGFQVRSFGEGQFQKSLNGLEWRYILKKIQEPRFT